MNELVDVPTKNAVRFLADPSDTPVLEGGDECAFLIQTRQIVAMTADAKQLLSSQNSFTVQNRQLSLGDERADAWLYESIASLAAVDQRRTISKVSRQLLISTLPNDYILTLVRVRMKLDAGARVDSMLFVHNHTKVSGGLPKLEVQGNGILDPWANLGFTQAETVIAKRLLEGLSVSEIAEAQSISREGVRFHIKGLLGKARCNRQSQLVAKLARLRWGTGH